MPEAFQHRQAEALFPGGENRCVGVPLPPVQFGFLRVVEQFGARRGREAFDLRVQLGEAGAAADQDEFDTARGTALRGEQGAEQAGIVLARLPGANGDQA